MKTLILLALVSTSVLAGPFAPSAGISGSTAISKSSSSIVGWATGYLDYTPGPQDISDPSGPLVTWPFVEGDPNPAPYAALGPADAELDSLPVVSLGDGGSLTLTFAQHIHDGNGFDFAVFENGITDTFLELAFVEVSSDGLNYTRFASTSATQTTTQVGPFGALNATNLNNLAGKYRRGFGTPFDLAELIGTPGLNLEDIGYVRLVDAVGSIDPLYATHDSLGNIINDPWKTPYETGGFDLDAIAVLNAVPEPTSAALLLGCAGLLTRRRKKHAAVAASTFGVRSSEFRVQSSKNRAFTLIELLVVMSVVAIVAALLFSTLGTARASADAITCMQNLRALSDANLHYATDHDTRFCFAQARSNNLRWHGSRHDAKVPFDPTQGPLSPYLGHDAKVKLCPSFAGFLKDDDSFETGCGGYGYNAIYVGGTPTNKWDGELTVNIPSPGHTVMFTDTALSRSKGVQEYAYTEPWEWVSPKGELSGALSPSVHFRHGGKANVAWCDGHVTAEAPTKLGDKNFYNGDDAKYQIGWFGPSEENGYWNPLSSATN